MLVYVFWVEAHLDSCSLALYGAPSHYSDVSASLPTQFSVTL
jgi:hypothetical protein